MLGTCKAKPGWTPAIKQQLIQAFESASKRVLDLENQVYKLQGRIAESKVERTISMVVAADDSTSRQFQGSLMKVLKEKTKGLSNININVLSTEEDKEIASIKFDVRCMIFTEGAGRLEAQQVRLKSALQKLPTAPITFCILLLPRNHNPYSPHLESFDDIIVEVMLYQLLPSPQLTIVPQTVSSFVNAIIRV